ncbi:MAG: hypothetical protein AAGI17_07015 [Planctomycetota bacterium]
MTARRERHWTPWKIARAVGLFCVLFAVVFCGVLSLSLIREPWSSTAAGSLLGNRQVILTEDGAKPVSSIGVFIEERSFGIGGLHLHEPVDGDTLARMTIAVTHHDRTLPTRPWRDAVQMHSISPSSGEVLGLSRREQVRIARSAVDFSNPDDFRGIEGVPVRIPNPLTRELFAVSAMTGNTPAATTPPVRPLATWIWLDLPGWLAGNWSWITPAFVAALLVASAPTVVPVHRRVRRRKRGLCLACGYDLSSVPPGSSCPECNTPRE